MHDLTENMACNNTFSSVADLPQDCELLATEINNYVGSSYSKPMPELTVMSCLAGNRGILARRVARDRWIRWTMFTQARTLLPTTFWEVIASSGRFLIQLISRLYLVEGGIQTSRACDASTHAP